MGANPAKAHRQAIIDVALPQDAHCTPIGNTRHSGTAFPADPAPLACTLAYGKESESIRSTCTKENYHSLCHFIAQAANAASATLCQVCRSKHLYLTGLCNGSNPFRVPVIGSPFPATSRAHEQ